MAWTELTRKLYERATPRYSSDVTDAEWIVRPQVSAGEIHIGISPHQAALTETALVGAQFQGNNSSIRLIL